MANERTRKKIVDAFMALARERGWNDITLTAIAERADVDLAVLRDAYDGRLAILEDFARRIDVAVLKGDDADMADETARERLFDVLMRRFDALGPHKSALRSLTASARRDPMLTIALGRIATVSQSWMLAAAGIESAGLFRLVAINGLVVAYARAFRVWLRDDDPGLARTMSALDRELRRGEAVLGRLNRVLCRTRRRPASMVDDAPQTDAA